MANTIFKKYDNIKIAINELSIEVTDDKASAFVNTTGIGDNKSLDKLEYSTLKFNINLIKKENRWLVESIEWLEPETIFSPFIS